MEKDTTLQFAEQILEIASKDNKALFFAILSHERGYYLDSSSDRTYLEDLYSSYIDSDMRGIISEDFEESLSVDKED